MYELDCLAGEVVSCRGRLGSVIACLIAGTAPAVLNRTTLNAPSAMAMAIPTTPPLSSAALKLSNSLMTATAMASFPLPKCRHTVEIDVAPAGELTNIGTVIPSSQVFLVKMYARHCSRVVSQ
jgi:hypothetical protein